jgi:peroxiredoxin
MDTTFRRRALVAGLGLALALTPLAIAAPGRSAAAIRISLPGGRVESISSYKGKPVLLVYFVTDCRHCQVFMGGMNQLYKEYGPKGIEFLGVALDEEPEMAIKGFVNRYQIRFPVGFANQQQFFQYTALDPNTRPFVPILSVVERDGTIRLQFTGRDPLMQEGKEVQNLRGLLNSLLISGKSAAAKK